MALGTDAERRFIKLCLLWLVRHVRGGGERERIFPTTNGKNLSKISVLGTAMLLLSN